MIKRMKGRINDWIMKEERKVMMDERERERELDSWGSDDGSCDKVPLSQRVHFLLGS
jgi:hypothetical protein